MLKKYNDHISDLILEKIINKEIPLILSKKFKDLLNIIDHPIKIKFDNFATRNRYNYKQSFINLDDSGLDKVSFITSSKAISLYDEYFKSNDEVKLDIEDILSYNFRKGLEKDLFSKNRTSTTIGRLINKLFPDEFPANGKPGEDIESFVNLFKSNRDIGNFELVNGQDIIYWYNEEQYLEDEGTLGESCMKYENCSYYIEFYAINPNNVSLLILKDDEDNTKIKGRAIVWNLTEPEGRIYMDRIYYTSDYYVDLFKKYAKEQGWLYKDNQNMQSNEYIVDSRTDNKNRLTLIVNNMHTTENYEFPYMDTLKFFSPDNYILSNDKDKMNSAEYYLLEDTGGGYSEEESGTWSDYYGEYIDEDDLVYCELGYEYRKEDDAIWIDFYKQSATEEYTENNMEDVDYADGWGYGNNYREYDDYITLYDSSETACRDYAENNLPYSEHIGEFLRDGDAVWSNYLNDHLYRPESTEVWLDAEQTYTDWRPDDDDSSYFEYEGEYYDEDVDIEDLRDEDGND